MYDWPIGALLTGQSTTKTRHRTAHYSHCCSADQHTMRDILLLLLFCTIVCTSVAAEVNTTKRKPDALEMLIGNSYLKSFISTEASADIDRLSVASKSRKASNDLTPVVIIPSLIGSKFQIRLQNRYTHWFCESNSDWYTIWVPNFKETFLPFVATCWLDNISLNYNMTTHWGDSPQGVYMHPFDYGGVDDVEYLDDDHKIGLWNVVIDLLVKAGYTVGKNLRAAPYDWRISPVQYESNFKALKQLIEQTYALNGNRSVALTSLSMGGSYTLLFLNTYVSQQWKDQYIHSWTSFCSPFGGSLNAVLALASSYNFWDMPWYVLTAQQILSMTQSFGSVYWLLPYEQLYGDMAMAVTPSLNYTAADFEALFRQLDNEQGADMYARLDFARTMQAPGVRMNCIHGWNVSTPHQIRFASDDLYNADTSLVMGDGDGTVPIKGLKVCEQWQQEQPQPINTYAIANMVHGSDIKNTAALKVFLNSLGIEVTYKGL